MEVGAKWVQIELCKLYLHMLFAKYIQLDVTVSNQHRLCFFFYDGYQSPVLPTSRCAFRLTAGCGKGLESEHVANPGLVLVEGDIVFPPTNDLTIKKPGKCCHFPG